MGGSGLRRVLVRGSAVVVVVALLAAGVDARGRAVAAEPGAAGSVGSGAAVAPAQARAVAVRSLTRFPGHDRFGSVGPGCSGVA